MSQGKNHPCGHGFTFFAPSEDAVQEEAPPEGLGRQVEDRVLIEEQLLRDTMQVPAERDPAPESFVLDCLRANELGDGALYASLHQGRFVYNVSAGEWLKWTGHHWERDHLFDAAGAVENIVRRYLQEAAAVNRQINATAIENEAERGRLLATYKELKRRAERLRSKRGRENCLHFAYSLENDSLSVRGDELDSRPTLLACANGVIDLETGDFRAGRPKDHLMKASPTEWQGLDAEAPNWERALSEIFSGRADLIAFVQRLFGCALVGSCQEAIFPVLTGQGRNGKSLIVETINHVLGDLAGPIGAEMLLDQGRMKSSTGPSPDIMALRGMRLAFASETDDGRRISPSRVKWMTGGDTLCGRNPHDKYTTEFTPTHTLFLLTNHKPHAPADDFAFWERALLIPFEVSFVSREPRAENERRADKTLGDRLQAEATGILAWLVKGCLLWQTQGLNPPAIVREATAEYRKDEDFLGDFLDECCVLDPGEQCNATRLYQAFASWFERVISKRVPTQKVFGRMMARRFQKETKGTVTYIGVCLREG